MIPKKIHYCWFGKNEIPKHLQKCIDSWHKYCPEYEIIQWNEDNYDVNKIDFIKEAYKNKNYAFVSDYARLDIVYNNGGFYLDTDVELLKSLDDLRNLKCFFGCELKGDVATGLGFGAKENFWFLKENMSIYENSSFYELNKTCVEITTDLLFKKGLRNSNKIQYIDDIVIYPVEYFNPKSMITGKLKITENSYSIHHYDGSWQKTKSINTSIKIVIRLCIDKIFGKGSYRKILRKLKLKK